MIKEYYIKGKDILLKWWKLNRNFIKTEKRKRKVYTYKKVNIDALHQEVLQNASPCFVLSTGRAGTALLTKILSVQEELIVEHNPIPELTYHSGYAYKFHKDKPELCKAMIDAARYEYIRNAFILDKIFVETNPRITFFAHQLAELYPKAKFIHLIRKPEDFIRSGLARNWYVEGRIRDEGKIKPDNLEEWQKWSQADKIAWLWQETNAFIEGFKDQLEEDRIITVRSEDLFQDPLVTNNIMKHLGLNPLKIKTIEKYLKKPVNRELKKAQIQSDLIDVSKVPLKLKYYSD